MSTRKRWSLIAWSVPAALMFSGDASAGEARGYLDPLKESAMPVDLSTLHTWTATYLRDREHYASQAIAYISPSFGVGQLLGALPPAPQPTLTDLLPYVPYTGRDRNQNSCGNCFAWAATGAMEIARALHDNASPGDRLSIQYFNSCYRESGFTPPPCCGGQPEDFVKWYNCSSKVAIPWELATFADGELSCERSIVRNINSTVACDLLNTSAVQYPIAHIGINRIETGHADRRMDQATAITRIKRAINAGNAVIFTIILGSQQRYNDFVDWWRYTPESDVWNVDLARDTDPAPTGFFSSHTMLIVGYDDTSSNFGDHYWTVLNSFGVTDLRLHGVLRMKMNMDYKSLIRDEPVAMFRTLDVQFADRTPSKGGWASMPAGVGASWQPESETVMCD